MNKISISFIYFKRDLPNATWYIKLLNCLDPIYASKYLRAVRSQIEDCEYYEAYDQADTENQPQQSNYNLYINDNF